MLLSLTLFTCRKHLHDRIFSLIGEVWGHKASLMQCLYQARKSIGHVFVCHGYQCCLFLLCFSWLLELPIYFLARFILYPSPIGHYDIKLTLLVHGNVLHCLFSVFIPSHDVSTFEHARRFCCWPPLQDELQCDHSDHSFQPKNSFVIIMKSLFIVIF